MHERLIEAIRDVRRRWRLRLAMRGAAVFAACSILLVVLAAWLMDTAKFEAPAVLALRLGAWASLAALAWVYLVRPMRRRVTDAQVALYLEEHEPSLSGQVAGAVQFGGTPTPGISAALVDALVARAVERCEAAGGVRAIEQPGTRRSAMMLGAALATAVTLALINPPFVARGVPFLLPVGAAAANPYAIDVLPGDTVLARGADLRVAARLRNFDADVVTLAVGRGTEWERFDMQREDDGARAIMLFDLDSSTSYYIEAGGVRSRVYSVDVRDLPYVKSITVTYHFPAYTGMPSQRQDDGGDIAALPGTRVEIGVTATRPTTGGALLVTGDSGRGTGDGSEVPLVADSSGMLAGAFEVRREGSYRVHLAGADGHRLPASPDYLITLLEDQPPTVTLTRPGRDARATNVEELLVEARAEDDYGVRSLELVYRVNGGEERAVPLRSGTARREVTGAHTLFLEEMSLVPGDVVSLFARARDARPGSVPGASDIYFVTIRPFDRTFREAEQGQPGQGEPSASPGELSQRQREIVAGTYNLVRDSARYTVAEYRQNLATLALAQGRLREEVNTLASRLVSRGVASQDSGLAQVAAILPVAVREMIAAEEALGRRAAGVALPSEQRALQQLQRAETIFQRETQVQRGDGPQGGQGGQSGEMNEELRDLFELDLDRVRSQYEQVERGERERAQQEVDELLERLRELARRQQQENERREAEQRRQQAQGQRGAAGGGGGGQGQRGMAEEAAELARRLERLTREESSPELADAARRLQQAADAMRRAAADGRGTQGASALEQLREARRRLEQGRSSGLQREARELEERARRLADQQREVASEVERLNSDDDAARAERTRRLVERKQQMAEEVGRLGTDVERVSRDARAEQPDAARRLAEAARATRDARLEDKLRFSRGVIQGRSPDYARAFEEQIGTDIDDLRRRLGEAAGAIGETREQRVGRALDRARELANALEGMGERAREGAQPGGQAVGRSGGQGGDSGQAAGRPGGQGNRPARSDMARRMGELDGLREMLRREGVDVGQLDRMRGTMGRLDSRLAAGDTSALGALQRDVVDGLKEFEFALRRALAGRPTDQPQLRGADEVAPEYRRMVEEYYRSLAGRRN